MKIVKRFCQDFGLTLRQKTQQQVLFKYRFIRNKTECVNALTFLEYGDRKYTCGGVGVILLPCKLKPEPSGSHSPGRGLALYNTIMANLEEKTRKIENLECQMINTSDVISEATSRIEKERLYSETLSGNHQKRAEQKNDKH